MYSKISVNLFYFYFRIAFITSEEKLLGKDLDCYIVIEVINTCDHCKNKQKKSEVWIFCLHF